VDEPLSLAEEAGPHVAFLDPKHDELPEKNVLILCKNDKLPHRSIRLAIESPALDWIIMLSMPKTTATP
jgi:hypothetical protein